MKCIIVDDEPLARAGLSNYARELDFLEVVGLAQDPLELISILDKKKVDLIFLDIQMPKLSGFDFLKMNKDVPLVIITTAFPSYAIEGFEHDVVDYLLKPITFDRFVKAVTKARNLHHLTHQNEAAVEDYFFVKCEHKYEKILFSEILYIKGLQNYVSIVTSRQKFVAHLSLKNVEEELSNKGFIRLHKSYIVNTKKIKHVESSKVKIGDHFIPISRNYKESVLPLILGDKLWKR